MTDHAATARWLIARAKSINADIYHSRSEVAQAENYVAPYALAGIKAELEKAAETARYMADGAAAILELESRLDDALERLSDLITIEALVVTLARFDIDALDELLALVHDVTSGEAA